MSRGVVLQCGVQTSPATIPYWNTTYFVLIRVHRGMYLRYAELGTLFVRPGDHVRAGRIIGTVGEVIDRTAVTKDHPRYIRELCGSGRVAMLHLEVCRCMPHTTPSYLGGNWLAGDHPSWFADPAPLLRTAGLKSRVRTPVARHGRRVPRRQYLL